MINVYNFRIDLYFFRSLVSKEIDRRFREIVNSVVDERDKTGNKRDDLLQVILDLRDKFGRVEFNENTVVGHCMTFLVRIFVLITVFRFFNITLMFKD